MYGTESSNLAGEGQSIGELIFQEMRKSREESRKVDERKEKQDIESQLQKAFDNFSSSFKEIRKSIAIQNEIVSQRLNVEKDILKEVQVLSGLLTQRNILQQSFNQIQSSSLLEKKSTSTPQVNEVSSEPASTEEPDKPDGKKSNPLKKVGRKLLKSVTGKGKGGGAQTKLAEGGVVAGKTEPSYKSLPFHEVMSMPLRASSLAAIGILSDLIKSAGAVSAFAEPMIKETIYPYASSFGVTNDDLDRLLGSPLDDSKNKKDALLLEFSKTWGMFLKDDKFINNLIDRQDPNDPEKPPGYVPANWKDDPEFTAELNRVAQKFNINANDLLAVMLVETGGSLDPSIRNSKSGATGLIQFMPSTARGLGTTTDELARMTRAEQMKYVEKYMDGKLPQGATGGQIYAAVFLPAFINEEVLTVRGEAYYNDNVGLDYNQDGQITRSDLDAHVEAKKKQYKLQSGGNIGKLNTPLTPYLISGPESGFDTTIQGIPVTLHGEEIIVPSTDGFQVFPVKNKKYDFSEDPFGVVERWGEIAKGSNKTTSTFASGGSADFWKVAALTSKEDSLHSQGQADVAQALYNRAAIGSYPGGKSLGAIITAPGQFEPTFHNAGAWTAIRDRNSAVAAAGNASKVDMAAKSITNPSLQKESQKFIGGRTDFMGESQKPHMKAGDVTRGAGYNFHGWFYDAKLANPAPVPKMVSSQKNLSATSNKPKPKVVVNNLGQRSQSQPVVQTLQSVTSSIVRIFYDPLKHRNEKRLRNTK